MAARHTLSKPFFKSMRRCTDSADVVSTFHIDSKVGDRFCGAHSGSTPSQFFSNYLFGLAVKPFQDNFQHDFDSITTTGQ